MGAVSLLSGPDRIRIIEYAGDNMSPLIERNSLVAWRPIDRFDYDVVFLLNTGSIYRVSRCRGGLRLSSDNKVYSAHDVLTPDEFAEIVVGKVTHALKDCDRSYTLSRSAAA